MARTELPPLTALRAFEAAARHVSFKAAAADLVTPTAISHQLRQLESWLGVRVRGRTSLPCARGFGPAWSVREPAGHGSRPRGVAETT